MIFDHLCANCFFSLPLQGNYLVESSYNLRAALLYGDFGKKPKDECEWRLTAIVRSMEDRVDRKEEEIKSLAKQLAKATTKNDRHSTDNARMVAESKKFEDRVQRKKWIQRASWIKMIITTWDFGHCLEDKN